MTLTERVALVLQQIDAKLNILPDGDLRLALRCLKTAFEGLLWIYDHNAHHTTERAISALTTLCDTLDDYDSMVIPAGMTLFSFARRLQDERDALKADCARATDMAGRFCVERDAALAALRLCRTTLKHYSDCPIWIGRSCNCGVTTARAAADAVLKEGA